MQKLGAKVGGLSARESELDGIENGAKPRGAMIGGDDEWRQQKRQRQESAPAASFEMSAIAETKFIVWNGCHGGALQFGRRWYVDFTGFVFARSANFLCDRRKGLDRISARAERMKHPRPMDKLSTRRRRNSPIRRRSVTTKEGNCARHWGTKQNDVASVLSGAISRDALGKSSENCPKTLGHFWKVFRETDVCSRAYIMRFP